MNGKENVFDLLDSLKRPSASEKERIHAASALREHTDRKDVVDALVQALEDESVDVCSYAAYSLVHTVLNAEIVNALFDAYIHARHFVVNHGTRTTLCLARKNDEAIDALIKILRDKEKSVKIRCVAATALGTAPMSDQAIDALLVALKDDAHKLRETASESLKNAPINGKVARALLDAYQTPDQMTRAHISIALCNGTKNDEAISVLIEELGDKKKQSIVRSIAARALDIVQMNGEVVDALVVALEDSSDLVRSAAAASLQNAPMSEKVIRALVNVLTDKHGETLFFAIHTLSNVELNEIDEAKVAQAWESLKDSPPLFRRLERIMVHEGASRPHLPNDLPPSNK